MDPGIVSPDPALPLWQGINQALQPFIGPFDASTAQVVDNAGNVTDAYSSVVRARAEVLPEAIPVDSVAGVIVCDEELTIEGLRGAYQRVRQAKALTKTKGTKAEQEMTMGLILARHSSLPLEQISDGIEPPHCDNPFEVLAGRCRRTVQGTNQLYGARPGRRREGSKPFLARAHPCRHIVSAIALCSQDHQSGWRSNVQQSRQPRSSQDKHLPAGNRCSKFSGLHHGSSLVRPNDRDVPIRFSVRAPSNDD